MVVLFYFFFAVIGAVSVLLLVCLFVCISQKVVDGFGRNFVDTLGVTGGVSIERIQGRLLIFDLFLKNR